ncbi:MAG: ABC transporter permease [Xanthomonadales bacterium]|nr:ABC transporter permease [Xanthomonadales bacterium]
MRPGILLLAWRNLAAERVRFLATLAGVAFAVVLMGAQLGLLLSFARAASILIDHADADLWVTQAGTRSVDIAAGLDLGRRHLALAVPGVAAADPYMVQFAFWRRPDGGNESVIVTGFDLASGRGGPWNLVAGEVTLLRQPDAVIVDRLFLDKLGVRGPGDWAEINNRRARIVGITSGIRTFTQSPYVFTSHARAQEYTLFSPEQTTYLLVKLAPGADREAVRAALAARLAPAAVWTREEFAHQSQRYWLLTTGAGSALLLATLLGMVVGVVIVGQTLFAITVDRLREYATWRALGASRGELMAVILAQAAIAALGGYGLGSLIVLVLAWLQREATAAIAVSPAMLAVLFLLTLAMCFLGALIALRRMLRLDPCEVFR